MPFNPDLSISGIQELQRKNNKRIQALKPSGAFGQAIKHITITAHRYLLSVTHVETGSYKGSQRMDLTLKPGNIQGKLFVDPRTVNPRTGQKPLIYSKFEEARGGEHASYQRTKQFIQSSGLLGDGISIIRRAL